MRQNTNFKKKNHKLKWWWPMKKRFLKNIFYDIFFKIYDYFVIRVKFLKGGIFCDMIWLLILTFLWLTLMNIPRWTNDNDSISNLPDCYILNDKTMHVIGTFKYRLNTCFWPTRYHACWFKQLNQFTCYMSLDWEPNPILLEI